MQFKTNLNTDLKDWWYCITTIFAFRVMFRLVNITINLWLFLFDIDIESNIPPVIKHYFKNIFCKSFEISKYKNGEIQLWFENTLNTGIEIFQTIHTHHERFEIGISLLGFSLHLSIYDTRHWDDENDKYEE